MKDLTIIIYCCNSEATINNILEELIIGLSVSNIEFKIIIIDDNSQDETYENILNFYDNYEYITYISSVESKGKGYLIRELVSSLSGSVICYLNADFAISSQDIIDSYHYITNKNYDMVIEKNISNSFVDKSCKYKFRKYINKKIIGLSNFLFSINLSEPFCGFKMFKSSVAKYLTKSTKQDGMLFDIELLYLATRNNYEIIEKVTDYSIERNAMSCFEYITILKNILFIKKKHSNEKSVRW